MAAMSFSFKSIFETFLTMLFWGLVILVFAVFVAWVILFAALAWRPHIERAEAIPVPAYFFYPYRARSIDIAQRVRKYCMNVKRTYSDENLTTCREMIEAANRDFWVRLYKYSGSADDPYHFDDLEWEMGQIRIRRFDALCDDALAVRALKHCRMNSEFEWHCPLSYAITKNYPMAAGVVRPYDKVTESAYYLCMEADTDHYWTQACKCANVMLQCVDHGSKYPSVLCENIPNLASIYGYENSAVFDTDKIGY